MHNIKIIFLLTISIFFVSSSFAQDITVNIPTLPQNKSVTITYSVTVNDIVPTTVTEITNGGTVSGGNFPAVNVPDIMIDFMSLGFELTSPAHMLWNGFLGMVNIVSILNKDTNPTTVNALLRNSEGVGIGSQDVPLAGKEQIDIIVNDVAGFEVDNLGTVELTFPPGAAVDANAFFYRQQDSEPLDFDIYMGAAAQAPLMGTSVGLFNTIQPSEDPAEAGNAVTNWLTIVNRHTTDAKDFTVELYPQQGGPAVSTATVTVPALGRRDMQAGHENPGLGQVGMVKIIPNDSTAEYLAQLFRYGSDQPLTVPATSFDYAVVTDAREGNANEMYLPISAGGNADNYAVVANASTAAGSVQVDTFENGFGLINSATINLAAYEQTHIYANSILSIGASGAMKITPIGGTEIVAESNFFFRAPDGGITDAYSSEAREITSSEGSSSYNAFLGQFNFVKVFNPAVNPATFDVALESSAGSLGMTEIGLASNDSTDLAIHLLPFAPAIDTVGFFEAISDQPNGLAAEMLRIKPATGDLSTVDGAESIPVR